MAAILSRSVGDGGAVELRGAPRRRDGGGRARPARRRLRRRRHRRPRRGRPRHRRARSTRTTPQVAEALLEQLRASDGTPHRAPDFALPTWESAAEALAGDLPRRPRRRGPPHPDPPWCRSSRRSPPGERSARSSRSSTTAGTASTSSRSTAAARSPTRSPPPATPSRCSTSPGARRLLALPVLVRRLRQLRPDTVQVHLPQRPAVGAARRTARPRAVHRLHRALADGRLHREPAAHRAAASPLPRAQPPRLPHGRRVRGHRGARSCAGACRPTASP